MIYYQTNICQRPVRPIRLPTILFTRFAGIQRCFYLSVLQIDGGSQRRCFGHIHTPVGMFHCHLILWPHQHTQTFYIIVQRLVHFPVPKIINGRKETETAHARHGTETVIKFPVHPFHGRFHGEQHIETGNPRCGRIFRHAVGNHPVGRLQRLLELAQSRISVLYVTPIGGKFHLTVVEIEHGTHNAQVTLVLAPVHIPAVAGVVHPKVRLEHEVLIVYGQILMHLAEIPHIRQVTERTHRTAGKHDAVVPCGIQTNPIGNNGLGHGISVMFRDSLTDIAPLTEPFITVKKDNPIPVAQRNHIVLCGSEIIVPIIMETLDTVIRKAFYRTIGRPRIHYDNLIGTRPCGLHPLRYVLRLILDDSGHGNPEIHFPRFRMWHILYCRRHRNEATAKHGHANGTVPLIQGQQNGTPQNRLTNDARLGRFRTGFRQFRSDHPTVLDLRPNHLVNLVHSNNSSPQNIILSNIFPLFYSITKNNVFIQEKVGPKKKKIPMEQPSGFAFRTNYFTSRVGISAWNEFPQYLPTHIFPQKEKTIKTTDISATL